MAVSPQLILAALASLGPGLIGRLTGDPQQRLRQQLMALLSAQNVGRSTEGFYQQALASPAYSQAQGTIAAGANTTAGTLARELGARGIGTSGTGAVLSSLIPSIVGSQQAGLRTSAHQSAQERAMQQIQAQIAAIMGTRGPSRSAQAFAGGLDVFGPILLSYLNQQGLLSPARR